MLRPVVHVHVEFPIDVQLSSGRWIRVQGTGSGAYFALPADAYRLNAWMGLFHRRLVRVRGFGREFWIDANAMADAEVAASVRRAETLRPAWVPVAPPESKRRGCGCGARAA